MINVLSFAQAPPKGINYQTIVRDSLTGKPIAEKNMRIDFSLRDVTTQTVEFSERHAGVTSNKYGLVNIVIGTGTHLGGVASKIDMIKWANDQYEVGIKVDTGSGVFLDLGYTKLWSVPYSFYSKRSLYSDSSKQAIYADSAKKIVINAIPNRLVKVGHNGKFITHSRVIEDTLAQRIGFGIGPNNAGFHVKDEFGNNGFVVEGTLLGGSFPAYSSQAGTRMMWMPGMSAFRVGTLQDSINAWNVGNTGLYSFAVGLDAEAKGTVSLSMGARTKARGNGSAAIGGYANAFGVGSVALGGFVTAADTNSFVLGTGNSLTSPLVNSTKRSLIVGFNSNKPTLYIGPSAGNGYWGRVGIGTHKPLAQFHVVDTNNVPIVMMVESRNPTDAEIQLKASSGNANIKYSYVNNSIEKASTYYNPNDNSFRINTNAVTRVKIARDPTDLLQPYVGIGADPMIPDSNVRLSVKNGHIQVQQSPSLVRNASSTGYALSLSSNPPSTDVAGQITINTALGVSGPQTTTIFFARPYNNAPIIILTPANANAASEMGPQKIYVTSTPSVFNVHMDQPDAVKTGTFIFNYFVIETKN